MITEQFFDHIISVFLKDSAKLRAISEKTGIQLTRVHRLKTGKHNFKLDELKAIIKAYAIDEDNFAQSTLTKINKEQARLIEIKSMSDIDAAELSVANKFNMTVERLRWRLTSTKEAV